MADGRRSSVLALIAVVVLATKPVGQGIPRLVVDESVTQQTITGWEATAQAGQIKSKAFLAYRDRLMDMAVDDLGLNRLRVEVRSGSEHAQDLWTLYGRSEGEDDGGPVYRAVRYSTINDNSDPFVLNERGFWFSELDNTVENVVLPMKRRLEARGERLHVNVTYVAFTRQIAAGLLYHHQDPEEYAEFVQAVYLHLRTRYGLTPDSWEMVLEPDNTREWSPSLMRRAMIATANRLRALGVTPRFVAPSVSDMSGSVSFAESTAEGGLPPFWSELSYHRYGGVSDAALRDIAARSRQWQIPTAMLERGGAGIDELHADLKVAGNTAWAQFGLAYPGTIDDGGMYYRIDDSNQNAPRIIENSRTRFLRQYFKYIRRGAVRISAETSDPAFDPVAFINADGSRIVVVKAAQRGAFAVGGLAPGTYDATYTTASDTLISNGPFVVEAGTRVQIGIPDRGALTIFGRPPGAGPGSGKEPPPRRPNGRPD